MPKEIVIVEIREFIHRFNQSFYFIDFISYITGFFVE
jgi:hypothetical protein